ncbi:MAG: hypothetical protein K6E50_11820 [Lachnospiraceae bacterium]|nr:hypothetical protein [Lachnospiraceae bacterium]
MTTDRIRILGDGSGTEKAMTEAERFAAYHGMKEEDSMYVRLLTEEMMGMVRAITGRFEGEFWLESDEKEYRVCLRANAVMDKEKKKEMIALSSRKKNESTVGIMEMIRNIVEGGLYKEEDGDPSYSGMGEDPCYYAGLGIREADALSTMEFEWSLLQYRSKVEEKKAKDGEADEAWDQLEKSIVANIADDVRVGVRGDIVELTICKSFGK